jgi:monoamine oxidase
MPLTAADKERFVTFLVSEGYLDSADHAYRKNSGRGPGRSTRLPVALAVGFCKPDSFRHGWNRHGADVPTSGRHGPISRKGSHESSATRITHGVEVTSIHQAPDHVKVAYKNVKTGAATEVTADYCVSCLPLTILSRLDVQLSPETMAAVKATPYSPSAKIGLQMKRRFWEEDDKIFGGHLYRTCQSATLRIRRGATGATKG